MNPCEHKVQYYETDGMGIVHHSNYIRWFEEARVDLLEQLGFGYDRIEAEGYSGPVLEVACQYKTMSRFGETSAHRGNHHPVQRRAHDAALRRFRQGDRRGALHRRQPPLLHQFRRPSGDPAPLLAGIRRRARVPRYR
ncbi:MAG: acyl-CoA thioesterase [Butyricicoccaceae bacterium]